MKIFILAILVTAVASGVGALRAVQEVRVGKEWFKPFNPDIRSAEDGSRRNIVVLNGERYEFGMLQRGNRMEHDFILQNVSDHPVEIWVGESSCTCTVASLGGESDTDEPARGDTDERRRLGPGEKTSITLEWEGLTANPKFFQTAEIHTDDPDQKTLRLVVEGYVEDSVTISPQAIQMNNVSVEDGAVAVANVEVQLDEFPAVSEMEFMVSETADRFDVSWDAEPEPQESGGYVRRLVIRALPGLPIGTVSQRLRLRMDLKGDNTFYIPVTAKVESELSILGPSEYLSKLNLLRWGVVKRDQGRSSNLFVLVKGDQKETVKLEVESVEPEGVFDVEIQPVKDREAKTWTIPLKVRLRDDARMISRLGGEESGYGVVRLRTGHPVAKELQFKVQFAVQ